MTAKIAVTNTIQPTPPPQLQSGDVANQVIDKRKPSVSHACNAAAIAAYPPETAAEDKALVDLRTALSTKCCSSKFLDGISLQESIAMYCH